MITLSQRDIVQLMIEKIRANGSWKEGTYNGQQDPTHFEKGFADFCGEEIEHLDPETNYATFTPTLIEASYVDNTWGFDFKFIIHSEDTQTKEEKVEAYFDNDSGTWSMGSGKFFKAFEKVLAAESWGSYHDNTDPAGGGLSSHR